MRKIVKDFLYEINYLKFLRIENLIEILEYLIKKQIKLHRNVEQSVSEAIKCNIDKMKKAAEIQEKKVS